MSTWGDKTIPFWQETLVFPNSFFILISDGYDYRAGWPESFRPSMSELIGELSKSKTSYIRLDNKGGKIFVNILSGKIIVSCMLTFENNKLFLNRNGGLSFATNIKKTDFIRRGIRIEHNGIFILSGRDYNQKYTDNDSIRLAGNIKNLTDRIDALNAEVSISDEQQPDDEFDESESSKIEDILETLETYINKEYEIEDAKARAEKPFVYTGFRAENIATTYKYYYRITLLEEDAKRLREFDPALLQIRKNDGAFMALEVYDIRPKDSVNDIVVATPFQTDIATIDSSNELYLAVVPTLQKVRLRVIEDLRGKVSPNKWLIPLAAGVYKFKETTKESVPEYNKERPLLLAQKDGVDKGAGTDDIALVLGPPGTGKTTVILSWVKYFVAQGKKVLVASQSNMAVDNVLIRLDEEKEFECLRIGNESKVSEQAKGLLLENYTLNAQTKLVEHLSETINSLKSGKAYLEELSHILPELLRYGPKEAELTDKINAYQKAVGDQKYKLEAANSEISNLKNNNIFLEELVDCLRHCQVIDKIQARLASKKEDFASNEKQEVLLRKQLDKSLSKQDGLRNELIATRQKVDEYSGKPMVIRVVAYLFNKKNILMIDRISNKLASLEGTIETLRQDIESAVVSKIEINELIKNINIELDSEKSKITVSTHNLSIQNCKEKYDEFLKNSSIFRRLGFANTNDLESKISHTKNTLTDNMSRLNDLNIVVENGHGELNKLSAILDALNQDYLSLANTKPTIPEFVACQYVEDEKYLGLNSCNEQLCSKLIPKVTEDLNFYNSLIGIVLEWEKSICMERQSSLYETVLEYVDVVGATCIGINSNKLFSDIPFDVVIIDESGQIQLHNLMVPLSRAPKAILVGDHKQLPPVVDDELVSEIEEQGFDSILLKKSWFEILWDQMPECRKTMLDTQFRCPAIISDFVSKAFYGDKYFAGSGMDKKAPIMPEFNSTMIFIDTSKIFPSFERSRIIDGRTEILGNEVETAIIVEALRRTIEKIPRLATDNEIGIIVPYANHVLEVRKAIKSSGIDVGNLNIDDLVKSVDSYQGQERDVIIFAFSRSNKYGNIGFLADWRRLNVAVTRTKKQLIMIGSLNTLTKDNQKEHEYEFKQAMRILKEELQAKNSVIDGRDFFDGAAK